MKTATVRQIRNSFPAVLRLVQNGESVAITSRRIVVATLTPPPAKAASPTPPWASLDSRLAAVQLQPRLAQTGAELLAQDRERF